MVPRGRLDLGWVGPRGGTNGVLKLGLDGKWGWMGLRGRWELGWS